MQQQQQQQQNTNAEPTTNTEPAPAQSSNSTFTLDGAFVETRQKVLAIACVVAIAVCIVGIISSYFIPFGLVSYVAVILAAGLGVLGAYQRHMLALWATMLLFTLLGIWHAAYLITLFAVYIHHYASVAFPVVMTVLMLACDITIIVMCLLLRDMKILPP